MLNYKLFLEKLYHVNLISGKTDYNILKRRGRMNRLKHLIYQLEDTGSSLGGEKVSEILLGGTNLNVLDLSYPFVDLKVTEPVPGVTEEDELISVKTTRDKHTLKNAVTYVNGFKIGQLIQFAISKIDLNLYKSTTFKKRKAIKLSSVTSFYDNLIKDLFGANQDIYTFVFVHTLLFYSLLKEYLELLAKEEIIITDRDELYTNVAVLLCYYVDNKFHTNYLTNLKLKRSENYIIETTNNLNILFSNRIKEVIDSEDEELSWLKFIPESIRNIRISYCILFFNEDDEEKVVLNLCKTQSITFERLFKNTIKIWTESSGNSVPMHLKALSKKQNLYLNYQGVIKAFQSDKLKGDNVFNVHIQVEFDANWADTYHERPEDTKKMYVKVIDKVKSIPNDDKQTEILNLLNKFLNKIIDSDESDKYIKKFSDIFNH